MARCGPGVLPDVLPSALSFPVSGRSSTLESSSRLAAMLFVSHATLGRRRNILDVAIQRTLGGFQWWRGPGSASPRHLGVADIEIDGVLIGIDANGVPIFHQRDRTAFLSFRCHVANDKAV